jgi:hypothetical protein
MRPVLAAGLLLCAFAAGSSADKPKVSRAMIKAMEDSLDNRLQQLWPDDPAQVVGLTQGVYINAYGAVFVSEVNLAQGAGVSPFHPTVSADEVKRIHEKKAARLKKLRETMEAMLLDSAGSMDSVPADEQIALGISLFYWNWENRDGLPAQIVMHAPRKLLLQAKTGAADRSSIVSDEF